MYRQIFSVNNAIIFSGEDLMMCTEEHNNFNLSEGTFVLDPTIKPLVTSSSVSSSASCQVNI